MKKIITVENGEKKVRKMTKSEIAESMLDTPAVMISKIADGSLSVESAMDVILAALLLEINVLRKSVGLPEKKMTAIKKTIKTNMKDI